MIKAILVNKVLSDHKVQLARRVYKVLKVLREIKVILAQKALKGQLVHKALKVIQEAALMMI